MRSLGIVCAGFAWVAVGCDGTSSPAAGGPADGASMGQTCPLEEDTSGPDVSFERDLMPFFATTCAFGGCHDAHTRQAGLYLGPNFLDGPADTAARSEVLSNLLAVSTTAPSLHRVVAFDVRKSFLMLKVEGCQNRMSLACGGAVPGKPCGDRMPALSPALPPEKRDLLARWIARGATSADGG